MTILEYINTRDEDKITEYNKALAEKYPFILFDKDNPDYIATHMDCMPVGWRIAFGDSLLEELKAALIAENCLDDYQVLDVKEKWGELRWYANFETPKICQVLDKYCEKSVATCFRCGKQAEYASTGYVLPWCSECAHQHEAENPATWKFETSFRKI